MTICPNGITKYAIAERLGNYLNPEGLSEKITQARNLVMLCATISRAYSSSYEEYRTFCKKSRKQGCKVIYKMVNFLKIHNQQSFKIFLILGSRIIK